MGILESGKEYQWNLPIHPTDNLPAPDGVRP